MVQIPSFVTGEDSIDTVYEYVMDNDKTVLMFLDFFQSTTNSIEDQQLTPLDVPVSVEVCLKFIETHGNLTVNAIHRCFVGYEDIVRSISHVGCDISQRKG